MVRDMEQARQLSQARQIGRSVNAVVKGGPAGAAMRGFSLGMNLRQQAADGRFDGGAFYTVLFLSAIKDFVDLVTLGTIGTLINIFVTFALIIFFLGKRSILRRLLIRFFIGPMIVEMIPFLNIFPTYTIATIMFKLKADKMQRQLESEAEDVEQEAKWQERQAARLNAIA